MPSPEIIFSEDHQIALLGHMIEDPKIFSAAQLLNVDAGFFINANSRRVFDCLRDFVDKNHRHPTLAELRGGKVTREESKIVQACLKNIDQALTLKTEVGFDSLVGDLKTTRIASLLRESVETAVEKWNRKDVLGSRKELEDCVAAMSKVDHQGVTASTFDSETWSLRERQDRIDMRGKIVRTGIQFLDDAMDGVAPDDLVLIASKTGVGKSQLLAQIALAATAAGKKVFLLALEAAPGEMQRRLKFPALMRHYRTATSRGDAQNVDIDYVKYCHGEYTDLLAPYEDLAHTEYVTKYASLQTLYKHSASYTSEDTERDILRMAPKVDLILIDHLHYIDGNDKDTENAAAKKLIKKLREIGQSMRKPIIAAAHVRKTDGPRKFAPLLPGVEDVHGSSDLVKVATHVILLGPTIGLDEDQLDLTTAPAIDGMPTLMRLVKSRTAGVDRTQYTALCYFQQREGRYSVNYCLGRLRSADTAWSPVYSDEVPRWAKFCTGWPAPNNRA